MKCKKIEVGETVAEMRRRQRALAAGVVDEACFEGFAMPASMAEKSLSLDFLLRRYRFLSRTGVLHTGHSHGKSPKSGRTLFCRKLSRDMRLNSVPHLLQYISALPHRLTAKRHTAQLTVFHLPEATAFNLPNIAFKACLRNIPAHMSGIAKEERKSRPNRLL